jgi:hypothetical protein
MAINLWIGRGVWEGWSIRKHYESCKFGESVLVAPDGSTFYPNDLLNNEKFSFNEEKDFGSRNIRAKE